MCIKIETFVSQWSQWLHGNFRSNPEVTDKVSQQAIEILLNCPRNNEDIVRPLVATLSQFEFNDEQRAKIYAALSGTDSNSPQVRILLQSNAPFCDFAEPYTLKFADGELRASKAELSTYGNYFITRFNLGIPNKEIDLSNIEEESFEAIKNVMQGKIDLDSIDPESLVAVKDLASYFSIEDLEKALCKTVDDAIYIAHKYGTIDLTQYDEDLTEQHIDQILSLPCLQRIDATIDLKALFPKLSIIDDEVWKTHADMAAHGLDVDHAIDMRATIRNLHEMYRTLKIEGGAGITFIKMPNGLTVNKLLAITEEPLSGNPIRCRFITSGIVNLYGEIPLLEGYTFAVTDSVLESSRSLSVSEQREFVSRNGCDMPWLLEMMVLTLLTYVSSSIDAQKCLYSDSPSTYSRVAEQVGYYNLVVGGLSDDGLVFSARPNRIGIAGLRRF